jgi:hypothetical protein
LDDSRSGASRVPGDSELLFDAGRIDTGSAAGYARDDRRRPQVYEHLPRLTQHDRVLAVHTVGLSDCDRGVDRIHAAIVDATFLR